MESDYDHNCPACSYGAAYQKHNCREGSASAYSFDNYQEEAGLTAVYPGAGEATSEAFAYLCLKLNGEAGEVGEAYAKFLRGDYNYGEAKRRVLSEIGDVLWYLSQIATEFDSDFSEIADSNITKLRDRKARGVIKGSGNDR